MKAIAHGTIIQINDQYKDIELKTAEWEEALSNFSDGDKVIIQITKE